MFSNLIVARMNPESAEQVAAIFTEFDRSGMPEVMGTRRRELFHYRGLYFHVQDFTDADHVISKDMQVRDEFQAVSRDLRPHVGAFDPATWRSPADAMATRFYHWRESAR